MRDGTGRSRGFAFLTFVESASVDKVLSQMHTVDGKPVSRRHALPSLPLPGHSFAPR